VQRLEEAGVEVSVGAAGTVRDQLARGRTDVGIFLSEADGTDLGAGRDVTVDLVVGPQAGSPLTVQHVRTAMEGVAGHARQVAALTAAGLSSDHADRALRAAAAEAPRPPVSVTGADDETEEFTGLGRFDLGAATQLLLFVFLISVAGSATLIQARRYGVLARVLSAPVSTRQAILGEALGRFAIAMVQGVYIVVGTALLFGVEWDSWPLSLLVLAAFSAVAAAAAMVVGSLMDNDAAANGVGVGAGLVLGALGGCMTPLEFFPDTLRTAAHLTPHAWAYEAFAEIQRHDAGLLDIAPQLGVLVATATVLLLLGGWLLGRSLDRAL
jgi:ABC-2 type transport system permease protein